LAEAVNLCLYGVYRQSLHNLATLNRIQQWRQTGFILSLAPLGLYYCDAGLGLIVDET